MPELERRNSLQEDEEEDSKEVTHGERLQVEACFRALSTEVSHSLHHLKPCFVLTIIPTVPFTLQRTRLAHVNRYHAGDGTILNL